MSKPQPLLVTGAHNSGTTWVGRNLALSDAFGYIYEPFNPGWRTPGIISPSFENYYTYITAQNERRYRSGMQSVLDFRYSLLEGLRSGRDPRFAGRLKAAARDWFYFRRCRSERRRPLLKDPIALFSAEWLVQRFEMQVIVLIRHPAAFVHSVRSKGWRQPCKSLLSQPTLVQERLLPFKEDLLRCQEGKLSLLEEASFMWKLLYTQAAAYRERHPEWLFVRHEDLSLDPVSGFRELFAFVGVEYTPEIIQAIEFRSGLAAGELDDGAAMPQVRNSRANLDLWKQALTPQEIETVQEKVAGVSERFYTEEDWL